MGCNIRLVYMRSVNLCCSSCYFFCFKQKTAYEMRISDWSSDVCSSDLISGAWGRPTVVNNVESLCNIAPIVVHGADWFKGLSQGKSKDGGTKLYGVSGRAKRTGVFELQIGTSAREILEAHGGGLKDGYQIKCWAPGGASTAFLMPTL